ncbi:MAG: C25 family cysteine peptidase [Planctomycetota bacterium]|jgi:hypothetical protein
MRAFVPAFMLAALLTLGGAIARVSDAQPEERLPRVVGRVTVKDDGFVRIRAAELARVGAAPLTHVEVTRRGTRVPTLHVGSTGDLVFLAVDTAGRHTAYATYELWRHTEPVRGAPWLDVAVSAADEEPPVVPSLRVLSTDRVHGELASGEAEAYDGDLPTWFLAHVRRGEGASIAVSPGGAAPLAQQELAVRVYGTHRGPVELAANWGGRDLGTATAASAAGGATLVWRVEADDVPAETTALLLRDVSPPPPPPPPLDVSTNRGELWIDEIRLQGPTEARVGGQVRAFGVLPDTPVTLTVASGTADAEGPVFLALVDADRDSLGGAVVSVADRGQEAKAIVVSVPATGPHPELFASTAVRDLVPTAATDRPDPIAGAAEARHVILAVPELVAPSRRLSAHRTQTGTPSVVIPVTDVYDAFGHGEQTPRGIRQFVLALMEREEASLDYVLLAGDATLDRTDLAPFVTIPAPMARTLYNGATASDRLYTMQPGEATGGPSIGRLPFRETEEMERYVDRVIRYETAPPAHETRRLMRFVTSEGRFGPLIDRVIEQQFRKVLTHDLSPAYDVEVTFASERSPYLWPPPEFNDKVISCVNDGCLFLTYIGHGFAQGFDSLHVGDARFPILHVADVDRVRCEGTPPAMFVVACTTAIFDLPTTEGVGEALMKQPEGPVAYWGATRICHPGANTLLGRNIARFMSREEGSLRLGQILDLARDEAIRPTLPDPDLALIRFGIKQLSGGGDADRFALEGSWMYALLGDPALRVAFPKADLVVTPTWQEEDVLRVLVDAPLPDGTEIRLSLELPRDRDPYDPPTVEDPLDAASFDAIRDTHRRMNDLRVMWARAILGGGTASFDLEVPAELDREGLLLKAWAIAEGDVHQGTAPLP